MRWDEPAAQAEREPDPEPAPRPPRRISPALAVLLGTAPRPR